MSCVAGRDILFGISSTATAQPIAVDWDDLRLEGCCCTCTARIGKQRRVGGNDERGLIAAAFRAFSCKATQSGSQATLQTEFHTRPQIEKKEASGDWNQRCEWSKSYALLSTPVFRSPSKKSPAPPSLDASLKFRLLSLALPAAP